MKKLETEFLLKKLKEKAAALGRTPTKEDIDSDKDMPDSSTYHKRFGGVTEACKLLGLPVTRVENLSLDKVIELANQFYQTYNRAPTVYDFDNTPNYPHSSYVRKDLGLTWNQFLILSDLPIFTNGDAWVKNFKAERVVKKLLEDAKIRYKFLSVENINAPNSFILWDSIRVDVRYSSPVRSRNVEFWKFRLHLQSKKVVPDYYICVGFNAYNQFEKVFLIPTKDLGEKQEVVSININNIRKSKYCKYEIESFPQLL